MDALASDLLPERQMWLVSLACAFTTRQTELIQAIQQHLPSSMTIDCIEAAKKAASTMSMNNVYWRFWYLVEDKDYLNIDPQLSQEFAKSDLVDKADYEAMLLAVSAINICSGCLKTHAKILQKQKNYSKEQIIHIVRIAASIQGMGVAMAADQS